jgi:hypothetical protein
MAAPTASPYQAITKQTASGFVFPALHGYIPFYTFASIVSLVTL